jgi:hypothetical protein
VFLIGGFGIIFVFILLLWIVALASFGVGIAALVSIARTPAEAFGPWWDNTRQLWLTGIAISFLIPFGHIITGIMWFSGGREPLRRGLGYAGRPFWAGPPKPPPMMAPPGWPGYGPPPGPAPPPPSSA